METIFALASARGRSGVAVVRISGSQAMAAVRAVAGPAPPPRTAALRTIRDAGGDVLDRGLVIVFPEGQSFTGEPVAELQLHGSPAVVQAVLSRLAELDGLRMAEPGEFTRRALENDRLDLAQVEGLADLIEADTEAQRRQAMRVFQGDLGSKVEAWRARLIRAAALLEATIDFADEEVPEDVTPEVADLLASVRTEIRNEISGSHVAERLRDGFEVAIVGATNVGKSTLLNRLAGREAAITSEVAGTTRDVIEVRMDLRGIPVTILDTAGLRTSADRVEMIGVGRARERARSADLRIFLLDGPEEALQLDPEPDDIVVVGKADRNSCGDVSGLTGLGVDKLVDRITDVLEKRVSGAGVAVRERHRLAFENALARLDDVDLVLSRGVSSVDIAAAHLRQGTSSLAAVVGRIGVEDVLDEVFASFCLGK